VNLYSEWTKSSRGWNACRQRTSQETAPRSKKVNKPENFGHRITTAFAARMLYLYYCCNRQVECWLLNASIYLWVPSCVPHSSVLFHYQQVCAQCSQASNDFTPWYKNGLFAAQVQHIANFTFIGAGMWEYSPKTVKISNFCRKFVPQGRLACTFLRKFSAFVCIYGSF